jgi:hypothetical protein
MLNYLVISSLEPWVDQGYTETTIDRESLSFNSEYPLRLDLRRFT